MVQGCFATQPNVTGKKQDRVQERNDTGKTIKKPPQKKTLIKQKYKKQEN
jgi:hypothetical protein